MTTRLPFLRAPAPSHSSLFPFFSSIIIVFPLYLKFCALLVQYIINFLEDKQILNPKVHQITREISHQKIICGKGICEHAPSSSYLPFALLLPERIHDIATILSTPITMYLLSTVIIQPMSSLHSSTSVSN